jgi:hypothetical protein
MLTDSSLRYQVYSVDVTDYGEVKGSQGQRTQCSIFRVLGHKQVHGGRLIRIEAEQPADALGGLALVAECMPADATRRRGKLIFSEGQATWDFARIELLQINLAVLVLGVVSVGCLLLGAGKE